MRGKGPSFTQNFLIEGRSIGLLALGNRASFLLGPLAAVGRMPLTTYLTQSVVCTLLFYGCRMALAIVGLRSAPTDATDQDCGAGVVRGDLTTPAPRAQYVTVTSTTSPMKRRVTSVAGGLVDEPCVIGCR